MKRIRPAAVCLVLFAQLRPLAAGAGKTPLATAAPIVSPSAAPSAPALSLSPVTSLDEEHPVRLLLDGKVVTLSMKDYLFGVVAAEMPAAFAPEALKAQAVAARTFTLYRQNGAPMEEHQGADVCADSTHCKAYLSPEAAAVLWGDETEAYSEKLRDCVAQTDGVAIYYDGAPILSVFHSTSSGRTEAAADVWTQDLPYLKSVESPGEEASPRYYGQAKFSAQEFKELFSKAYPQADFSGAPESWFSQPERSEGGAVTAISVGGVTVSGTRLRELCALQSANITITVEDDEILMRTVGYGHGVGMSQYGAQAMALEGADYEEILRHYYTGVTILREETP